MGVAGLSAPAEGRERVEYREEPCKTALNRVTSMRSWKWSLNPYMGCVHRCTFCYVRAFEKLAERPADDRYGRSIRVKTNVVEVLERELSRPRWAQEWVGVGSATDPYQPAEGRYRLTRGCIEAFARHQTPFGIITRGPLVVRDVDVLQEASRQAGCAVNFSVPTLDEGIWRKTEPGTSPPRQRLRALKTLVDSGIKASVALAPILPGISDKPELIEQVIKEAAAAGACGVWTDLLYLKPGTREHFLESISRDFPELERYYTALYNGRAYLGRGEREPVKELVYRLADLHQLKDRRPGTIVPVRPAQPADIAAESEMNADQPAPVLASSPDAAEQPLEQPVLPRRRSKLPPPLEGQLSLI